MATPTETKAILASGPNVGYTASTTAFADGMAAAANALTAFAEKSRREGCGVGVPGMVRIINGRLMKADGGGAFRPFRG